MPGSPSTRASWTPSPHPRRQSGCCLSAQLPSRYGRPPGRDRGRLPEGGLYEQTKGGEGAKAGPACETGRSRHQASGSGALHPPTRAAGDPAPGFTVVPCSRRRRWGGVFHFSSLIVFPNSGKSNATKESQTNTHRHWGLAGNIMI